MHSLLLTVFDKDTIYLTLAERSFRSVHTHKLLTFGLECGKNGLDHAHSDPLTLCPLHEVDVHMGRVVSLELLWQEKLQVSQFPEQTLLGIRCMSCDTHPLHLLPPPLHLHTHNNISPHPPKTLVLHHLHRQCLC